MTISGYKHGKTTTKKKQQQKTTTTKKKKQQQKSCNYVKRKWVKGNLFWKQFTLCKLHKRFCISTCELLSKFQLYETRGMKSTNLLKLYMHFNFSRSIIETLTMLAFMLGLD